MKKKAKLLLEDLNAACEVYVDPEHPLYDEGLADQLNRLGWKQDRKIKFTYGELASALPNIISRKDEYYEELHSIRPDWFRSRGKQVVRSTPIVSCNEARRIVRRAKIKSWLEYKKKYKQFDGLPANPQTYYVGKGWVNFYDFFGKENTKPLSKDRKLYSSYSKAKKAARKFKCATSVEYRSIIPQDLKLPSCPEKVYSDWKEWGDYLGPEYKKDNKEWQPDPDISEYIKKHYAIGKSMREIAEKLQITISKVSKYIKHFSIQRGSNKYSLQETKDLIRKHNIRTKKDYANLRKKFQRLRCYQRLCELHGYKNWSELTGLDYNEQIKKRYGSFDKAKKATHKLGCHSRLEYLEKYKTDNNLISTPQISYPEWTNWPDFLGYTCQASVRKDKLQKLLEIAKARDPKPAKGTSLFYLFKGVTNKSSSSYIASFCKKLKKLRPDWFGDYKVAKNKSDLIEMAKRKEGRPHSKTKLGAALSRYICKSSFSYDAEFEKEIKKSDWFKKKTSDIKEYRKQYRIKNKKKRSEKEREQRRKNPEETRKHDRERYWRNRDRILENAAARRKRTKKSA